jgi:hypothetical protein
MFECADIVGSSFWTGVLNFSVSFTNLSFKAKPKLYICEIYFESCQWIKDHQIKLLLIIKNILFYNTLHVSAPHGHYEVLLFSIDLFRLLIVGVDGYRCTWSHSMTYKHSVALPWTSDRSVTEISTYTTHNIHNRQISMPRRDSNPRSQEESCRTPTHYTARPLGSARFYSV